MHKSHFGNLLMVCAAARSCWCVIICSSRSFFTVGVLFVLFSFEFLDVPPVGQTTLTSVLSSFSSNTHIIFTTSFNIVSSCIKFTFQSGMDKTTEQSGEEDACAFFQNKEAALRLLSGHFGLIDTDSEQSPDAFPLSKILNLTWKPHSQMVSINRKKCVWKWIWSWEVLDKGKPLFLFFLFQWTGLLRCRQCQRSLSEDLRSVGRPGSPHPQTQRVTGGTIRPVCAVPFEL